MSDEFHNISEVVTQPETSLQTTTASQMPIESHLPSVPRFDATSVSIDNLSHPLKEGKAPAPHIRNGVDGKGNKVFLKTSPFAWDSDLQRFLARDEMKPDDAEYLTDSLKVMERISALSAVLEIPMPYAVATVINQTPFIAMEHLGSVVDVQNAGFNFSEQSDVLRRQQAALAKGALLKVALGLSLDEGQYLQQTSPPYLVYLSDCESLPQVTPPSPMTVFNEIALQGQDSSGFFCNNLNALEQQLAGLSTPEFTSTINLVHQLTPDQISQILGPEITASHPQAAPVIYFRLLVASTILETLRESKNAAIRMLNPYPPGSKERLYTETEKEHARIELFNQVKAKLPIKLQTQLPNPII